MEKLNQDILNRINKIKRAEIQQVQFINDELNYHYNNSDFATLVKIDYFKLTDDLKQANYNFKTIKLAQSEFLNSFEIEIKQLVLQQFELQSA